MVKILEKQQILNKLAKEICPNLLLEFLCERGQPIVQTAYIQRYDTVSIDIGEMDVNNGQQLKHLLKSRIERSLIDLRKKLLEDLKELRKLK